MKDSPYDTCRCGDYRSDHDADGPCRLCRNDRVGSCTTFRLARRESELPEAEQVHIARLKTYIAGLKEGSDSDGVS